MNFCRRRYQDIVIKCASMRMKASQATAASLTKRALVRRKEAENKTKKKEKRSQKM